MAKSHTVAIAGATGAVGIEMIETLERRNFATGSLKLLASSRSVGRKLPYRGEEIAVEELTHDCFDGVDIALFSAGGGRSKEFAPSAVKAGAVVVDNSSAFRMDPDVPLVVPEVNPEDIAAHKGIIAEMIECYREACEVSGYTPQKAWSYVPRFKRWHKAGKYGISTHSWGIAIDFDSHLNRVGNKDAPLLIY